MQKTSLKRHCYKFFCKSYFFVEYLVGFVWLQSECKPCTSSPIGDTFYCGESKARDTSLAFESTMELYFVKKGKIEFLYRKDSAKEKDGWMSGIFSFHIDDEALVQDDNLHDDPNEWKYFSIDVEPGLKYLSFLYQKFNSESSSHMKMEIKELRVTGLEYADESC